MEGLREDASPSFRLAASRLRFRGFGHEELTTWRKAGKPRALGALLILSSFVGVLAREKIVAWTPDFHTSSFAGENGRPGFSRRGLFSTGDS